MKKPWKPMPIPKPTSVEGRGPSTLVSKTLTPVVPQQIYRGMTPKAQTGVTVGKVPLIQRNTPNVSPQVYKKMPLQKQMGVTATLPPMTTLPTFQPPQQGSTPTGKRPAFPKGPGGIQRKPKRKMFGM